MNKISDKHLWQTIAVGSFAGSRTSSGPAIASSLIAHSPVNGHSSPLSKYLRKKSVSRNLQLMMIPELIIDKLPSTGNRTAAIGVICRAVSGALCGGAIYHNKGDNYAKGMIIGGLSAIASTFALFYLRKKLGQKTSIPDPVLGLIEDGLVISGGVVLVGSV